MTAHYVERLTERMAPGEAEVLARAIEKLTAKLDKSLDYAIHVARLPEHRGSWTFEPDGTGTSNGNNIWAIIRHGRIATVMYRRDAQPSTKQAFRVDVVGRVKL